MPQLQNLVLTDRKATPVAHTFTPRSIEGNVAMVAETTGTPIGDPRVTVSLGKPTAQGRYKPQIRFTFPVTQIQTVNGVSTPVVVRTSYAELSFNFDQTTSEAERNDIVGQVQSALDASKTLINDTVVKLQGVF
jgi:hypothetical protein